MNRRQEIALFFVVAAFVATWMFPPWVMTKYSNNREDTYPATPQSENVGYRFIFTWAQQGWVLGNYFSYN
jgi:hypothetical protein